MGAFPFANENLTFGVQEDDPDANVGTGAGGYIHKPSTPSLTFFYSRAK